MKKSLCTTADLCDKFGDKLAYVAPLFQLYGGKRHFGGQIVTVKCFEDNSFVKTTLAKSGEGKVLVIDGGASLRKALVGDLIAADAVKNKWEGIIVNGCIRDSEKINTMPEIGIKAINTHPRKTEKKNIGDIDVPVEFGGVRFVPGQYLVADVDGIVVADFDITQ